MRAHLVYRELPIEEIDAIRLLWEKLHAQHVALDPEFSAQRARRNFELRQKEFQRAASDGPINICLASRADDGVGIGYCVTTLSKDGEGEVDSLYVEPEWRGGGVGSELVRRALAWLDANGATSKIIFVAQGNERAMGFYERFGFAAYQVQMRQVE